MSKLIPLLFAGAGTATVSVGGFYLVKGSGKTPSNSNGTDASTNALSADLAFRTLDEFKAAHGGECAKDFTNLNLNSSGGTSVDNQTNKIDTTYFSEGSGEKSCLIVNGERVDSSTEGTNQKGKGNFRWVWSFIKGNRGFIMFTTTKLSSHAKQLDLEGGIYFVNKSDSGNTGSIDKHKTLGGKNIKAGNFSTAFSKPGESLTGFNNKDSGGFLSSDTDLDKVCKENEKDNCVQSTDKTKTFRGLGTGSASNEGAASGTLTKGCNNFSAYFTSMYEGGEIDITTTLESLSGAGKNEVLENPNA